MHLYFIHWPISIEFQHEDTYTDITSNKTQPHLFFFGQKENNQLDLIFEV